MNHHHSVRARQRIDIDATNNRDTTKITIENPDDKEYVLVFKNPKTLTNTNSDPIKTTATTAVLRDKVRSYYVSNFGSEITVNLTMYDNAGVETKDESLAVKRIYFITVNKLIPTESAASIMVAKTSTTSVVTVETPSVVMLSSKPMSGSFKLKCTN